MKFIYYFNRIKGKVERCYRERLFKEQTGCSHNDFSINGKISVSNKNIRIGKNVSIYSNVCFFGDGIINIGDNVDIGNNTIFYASKDGGISIGSNTMIAANCYIIDTDHGTNKNTLIRNQKNSSKEIIIGDDVWIASHCSILKGSIIEDGAVIGANSLVKGKVNSYSICAGSPVRIIKYRK